MRVAGSEATSGVFFQDGWQQWPRSALVVTYHAPEIIGDAVGLPRDI
jgi:hypothetical protein